MMFKGQSLKMVCLGERKDQSVHQNLHWKLGQQATSHSAYVATETELYGAKIDGLLPPNFL